ncbi:MAG TPA: alpha/beta fold hydrolase [Stellaceae bacterium]|nr:alpha/beta fold hydrolase [Stellaceae bacterium]
MTVALAVAELGAGPAVAILHGLFGSGRNWTAIGRQLAARHRVLWVDLRNHGASPWAAEMSYPDMAEDVRAALAARGIARAALLGHSMGGKIAMAAALAWPERVARLVVADIAPVPYPPTLQGHVRAMQALDLAGIGRRSEADRRLAAAIPDPAERAFLLQNLVIEEGRARWRLNLAAIAGAMTLISDFPSFPPGRVYDGPALFVTGARSPYVRAEHEPAILRLFPAARLVRIAGAGHWVHAEAPAAFLAQVAPFLADEG